MSVNSDEVADQLPDGGDPESVPEPQQAAPERGVSADSVSATPSQPGRGEVNIEAILDVPVTLSMEVGRARVPLRSLLQLTQGSVVELERGIGEPLDVFVNGTLVAHGEVVVVDDLFGIRVTDVVSPAERIRKLK